MSEKKYPINPERLPEESFEAYKKRRKLIQKTLKAYKKGSLVWNSKEAVELPLIDQEGNMVLGADGEPLKSGKFVIKGTYKIKYGRI